MNNEDKFSDLLRQYVSDEFEKLPASYKRIQKQVYWRDIHPDQFGDWRGHALELPLSGDDTAIKTVFEQWNLDPSDQSHWRALVSAFCAALVKYDHRPSNRAQTWTDRQLAELAAAKLKVQLDHGDPLTNIAIAKILRTRPPYSATFGRLSITRLRTLISSLTMDVVRELAAKFPDLFKHTIWPEDYASIDEK